MHEVKYFCSKCNSEVDENWVKCKKCHSLLAADGATTTKKIEHKLPEIVAEVRTYPALNIIGTIYFVLGILLLIFGMIGVLGIIFTNVLYGLLLAVILMIVVLPLFAVNEIISLFINIEDNTHKSSELLRKLVKK